jgi:hypothetical protein
MEYEQFEKIILNLQKTYDQSNLLYKHGIDITEVTDNLHIIISDLLGIIFTDYGKDWIDWFIYEKEFGKREDLKAWDENKNEIAYDIKSLYELLINEYLIKK